MTEEKYNLGLSLIFFMSALAGADEAQKGFRDEVLKEFKPEQLLALAALTFETTGHGVTKEQNVPGSADKDLVNIARDYLTEILELSKNA